MHQPGRRTSANLILIFFQMSYPSPIPTKTVTRQSEL